MKVTSKEEMGLRCMMRLAERSKDNDQVTINEIAETEGLTPGYVGKLISQLRRGGLIVSVRGSKGRIALARDPADITLAEILTVLSLDNENSIPIIEAGRVKKNCRRYPNCNLKAVWGVVAAIMEEALSRVSLADLAWGNPGLILKNMENAGYTRKTKGGGVLTTTIRKAMKETK